MKNVDNFHQASVLDLVKFGHPTALFEYYFLTNSTAVFRPGNGTIYSRADSRVVHTFIWRKLKSGNKSVEGDINSKPYNRMIKKKQSWYFIVIYLVIWTVEQNELYWAVFIIGTRFRRKNFHYGALVSCVHIYRFWVWRNRRNFRKTRGSLLLKCRSIWAL